MNFKSETMRFEIQEQPNFVRRTLTRAFCTDCQREVGLVMFTTAEKMLGVSADEFLRVSEAGRIHWLHNAMGMILACSRSLKREMSRTVIILKPL